MPIAQSIMAQFEALNARAAALLSLVDDSGCVQCRTAQGEENILDKRFSPERYLHRPSGALKEAEEWVSSHKVEQVDFLVIFGIGLGWQWQALQPWLRAKRSRRLVFLEDDLVTIKAFLESEMAQPFFDDPQSTLLFLEDGKEGKHVREIIIWYAYKKAWSCLPSPFNLQYRKEVADRLEQELTVQQIDLTSIVDEYVDFRSSPLRNFGRDLYLWPKSLNGASLFGKFQGCPAIVVAAGPSLEKEIDHLKGLSSRALILAGGSSVNALLQAGIMPHIAVSVDPNPMQYIRLRQAQPFCLPLFYRSRALYEALMSHHGPLLYLRGGDGYPLVEWFEEELSIHGKILDGGHSVSNMLIDLAHALGCRPIIMVGYDLAYTGGARYPSSLSESMASGESVAFKGETQGCLIDGKTYDGRPVVTEVKWMIEAQWLENFKQKHPRLRLINTAQDGLAIHGLVNMSCGEALNTYCTTDRDIDSRLHIALQEASPVPFVHKKVAKAILKLSESFQKSDEILQRMRGLLAEQTIKEDESPDLLEANSELEGEVAFCCGLSPLSKLHTKLSQMRKLIDCRPLFDEERGRAFDQAALKERLKLMGDSVRFHQSFLYTLVAWGALNGILFPEALTLAPLQDVRVNFQKDLGKALSHMVQKG